MSHYIKYARISGSENPYSRIVMQSVDWPVMNELWITVNWCGTITYDNFLYDPQNLVYDKL